MPRWKCFTHDKYEIKYIQSQFRIYYKPKSSIRNENTTWFLTYPTWRFSRILSRLRKKSGRLEKKVDSLHWPEKTNNIYQVSDFTSAKQLLLLSECFQVLNDELRWIDIVLSNLLSIIAIAAINRQARCFLGADPKLLRSNLALPRRIGSSSSKAETITLGIDFFVNCMSLKIHYPYWWERMKNRPEMETHYRWSAFKFKFGTFNTWEFCNFSSLLLSDRLG